MSVVNSSPVMCCYCQLVIQLNLVNPDGTATRKLMNTYSLEMSNGGAVKWLCMYIQVLGLTGHHCIRLKPQFVITGSWIIGVQLYIYIYCNHSLYEQFLGLTGFHWIWLSSQYSVCVTCSRINGVRRCRILATTCMYKVLRCIWL